MSGAAPSGMFALTSSLAGAAEQPAMQNAPRAPAKAAEDDEVFLLHGDHPSRLRDGHAGLLVVRFLRKRAVRVLHRQVDQGLLGEEGRKHHALRRLGAAGRGHLDVELAEARLHVRHVAVGQAQLRASPRGSCSAAPRAARGRARARAGSWCPCASAPAGARCRSRRGTRRRALRPAARRGGTPRTAVGVGRLVEAQAAREVLLSVLRHAHLVEAVFLRAVAEAPERRQPLPVHFAHGPGAGRGSRCTGRRGPVALPPSSASRRTCRPRRC